MKTHNFYQKEEKELISINITPLIDIVFLLLVFFMLATSFIQKSTIEVNLSSGKTVEIEKWENIDLYLIKRKDNRICSFFFGRLPCGQFGNMWAYGNLCGHI